MQYGRYGWIGCLVVLLLLPITLQAQVKWTKTFHGHLQHNALAIGEDLANFSPFSLMAVAVDTTIGLAKVMVLTTHGQPLTSIPRRQVEGFQYVSCDQCVNDHS